MEASVDFFDLVVSSEVGKEIESADCFQPFAVTIESSGDPFKLASSEKACFSMVWYVREMRLVMTKIYQTNSYINSFKRKNDFMRKTYMF